MQSIATFFNVPSRPSSDGFLCWFRAAAWAIVVGAVPPSALAQGSADPAAAEKTQAAESDAASHSEPGVPAAWNRRRAAPTGADAQLRRLAADLKLDAAQQAKIRPILVARLEEMRRLQRDRLLTPTERRQRALVIGDRSAEQIRAQLTDAQRAQYIQARAATPMAQAQGAGRRRATRGPSGTAPNKGAAQ